MCVCAFVERLGVGARTVITILFSVVLLVFPMYNSGCGPADVINGYKRLILFSIWEENLDRRRVQPLCQKSDSCKKRGEEE